ncbi:RusA-like Holliday junction resolvase [Gordonia phage Catfish]|uniref:RusA-like resolvase n=1 Tax=Gordonia phage Catfish TaxID=2301538 RepID=A0A385D0L9_9CAUD|nr:RusA-like Holliday junction resolvase [Gordonia phage Catfish]AXQ51893.1 RusA-like resolvase [Gordonia phage Catfish]
MSVSTGELAPDEVHARAETWRADPVEIPPRRYGGSVSFFVPGVPAPQGSKRHVGNGRMIESSKRLKPWRADVEAEARRAFEAAGFEQLTEGVAVRLMFVMPRPKSAPKTRPVQAIKRPDVDKLARAVLDALDAAGAYRDDSQVIELEVRKQLTHGQNPDSPGVHVWIRGSEWH